ncbi:hypothetical protein ACFE04_000259 [Oxalis oulophora]
MEERVEIDELSLGQMMEDYSLYGDMHAKTYTFLTNVLKKWKGEEFFIHEVNGDGLYKLLDTATWVDDQSHWFLMVATVKTRKVQVFDSLGKHSELQKIMEWVSEVELAQKCIATEIFFGEIGGTLGLPAHSKRGCRDLLQTNYIYVQTPSKTLTSGTLCFILLGGSGISGIRAQPTTALPLKVPVEGISFVETYYKLASTNTN